MSNYASLRINPMDSAELPEIEANIETNLGLIRSWVHPQVTNGTKPKTAVLLGAGPSLKACLKSGFLHKDMFPPEDYLLFTCKHALPLLMEYGFTNLNCMVLDPRPIDGISTHDVKRRDLYDTATPDRVTFILASMTEPSVTQYLIDREFNIIGWHAASTALKKFIGTRVKEEEIVSGGTNSILRSILFAKMFYGINKFLLLGLDSSIEQPSKEEENNPNSYLYTEVDPITGHPKYLKSFFGEGESLNSNKHLSKWTTGEMAAQLSDLEQFFNNRKRLGIELHIIGTDKGKSLIGQLGDHYS